MCYRWINTPVLLVLSTCFGLILSAHFETLSYDNSTSQRLSNNVSIREKRQLNGESSGGGLNTGVAVATLLICTMTSTQVKKKYCDINVKTLAIEHALILNPLDHTKFIYPDESGNIHFEENEVVFLSCGINDNEFNLLLGQSYQTFRCVCGKTFEANGQEYDFDRLTCLNTPEYKVVAGSNNDFYKKYRIGFEVDHNINNFLELIEVFYMDTFKTTMYVKSEISKSLKGGQDPNSGIPYYPTYTTRRPKTLTASFDEQTQKQSFTHQFLTETAANPESHYLQVGTGYTFDRCFLTPRHSMVYAAAAVATYSYWNVVPQWKIINMHNWDCIERHVSEMAKVLKKDLIVYTGVYEGLQLRDKVDDNQIKDVYLLAYKEKNSIKRKFPVTLFNYKVVIEPLSRRGVVYVTVNSPYMKPGSRYKICSNPITKMRGVLMPARWQPKTPKYGYSYMCTIDDFSSHVTLFFDAPFPVQTTGLLYISDRFSVDFPAVASTSGNTFTDYMHLLNAFFQNLVNIN